MQNTSSNNAKIFESFKGEWNLSRIAKDPSQKQMKTKMEGVAQFTRQEDGSLLYEEAVHINQRAIGMKKYLFILSENAIEQYHFEPGISTNLPFNKDHPNARLMYNLNFMPTSDNLQTALGMYNCSPDDYTATYHIDSDSSFRTAYNIQGPNKDQNIETIYTKVLESTQTDLLGDE